MQGTAQFRSYTAARPFRSEVFVARGRAAKENVQETAGERVARLRKERGITQKEMALRLGVSQGNVSDYERGVLRLHADLIVELARVLDVSADEILGITPSTPPRVAKDKRLLRRVAQIDKLSKRDRDAVVRTIDAFLNKANDR